MINHGRKISESGFSSVNAIEATLNWDAPQERVTADSPRGPQKCLGLKKLGHFMHMPIPA